MKNQQIEQRIANAFERSLLNFSDRCVEDGGIELRFFLTENSSMLVIWNTVSSALAIEGTILRVRIPEDVDQPISLLFGNDTRLVDTDSDYIQDIHFYATEPLDQVLHNDTSLKFSDFKMQTLEGNEAYEKLLSLANNSVESKYDNLSKDAESRGIN